MIWNIIDRRERKFRWKRINAIIEPTWHDNSCRDSDRAEEDDDDIARMYAKRESVSLAEAVTWASAKPYAVTLHLYDEGRGTARALRYSDRHVLVSEELSSKWQGIKGWSNSLDALERSDYARACMIRDWIGMIPCGAGAALVLSGDAAPVAWYPKTPEEGHLVQWIAADGEKSIMAAIRDLHTGNLSPSSDAEEAEVATGPSGRMLLFNAALVGDDVKGEAKALHLVPGRYGVRAWCLRSDRLTLVIRQMVRLGST